MQTILITGANGFVGYYLCQQLLQKGYTVIATGKGECRLPFKGKTFVYQSLDFTNDTDVRNIFEEHRPETVVHCGAISKPDECELNKEKCLFNECNRHHLSFECGCKVQKLLYFSFHGLCI